MRHRTSKSLGVAASLLLAACGPTGAPQASTPAGGAPTTGTVAVSIEDFAFEPDSIEIGAGTSVVWTNRDMFAHTVTSGSPGAPTDRFDGDLGELASVDAEGTTFAHEFREPGTYAYFCRFHPRMQATVTVT